MRWSVVALCIAVSVALPHTLGKSRAERDKEPHRPPTAARHAAPELRAGPRGDADVSTVFDSARAALRIGSLDRARELLVGSVSPMRVDPPMLRLRALVENAAGNYRAAGQFYAAAAVRSVGVQRGVFEARAGDAFERAHLTRLAREHYRRAARLLPDVAGWLAVREVRLHQDTAVAARVLRKVGPAERRMAADAWAAALLRVGDSARALHFTAIGGRVLSAAELALAVGDAARSRRLLYHALRGVPAPDAAASLERLMLALPPSNPDEVFAIASGLRRLGRAPEVLRVLRATAAGDVGGPVLLAAADALADAGDRPGALAALGRAVRGGGPTGADAEYARARLLLRVRGEATGVRELLTFVRTHPAHAAAPNALLVVADVWERAGRRRAADSLYDVVSSRWPSHGAAPQAQLRLAVGAERARRFSQARWLYAAVRDARGPDRPAARFMLGRAAIAAGDSAAAFAEWEALAREDLVGYWGVMARQAAGLPALTIGVPHWTQPEKALRDVISSLTLLTALNFSAEADALATWAIDQFGADPEQLLALGRCLLDAGWTETAVDVGWRAAASHGLTDPRVLRLVFPWPLRDAVISEARKFDLDPYLLAGLIRQESLFRPGVTSRAGARGLMQLMPATAAEIAQRLGVEWHDRLLGVADANLHLGAAHLASLVRRFGGDEILALAAYNAGGRPVEQWRRRWGHPTDQVQFIDRIPYPETRRYVRTVVRNRALYRALYPAVDSP